MDKYVVQRDIDGTKVVSKNKDYWNDVNNRRFELLLKKAEIPKFYWSIDFEDYKGDISLDNVEKAKKFSENCFTDKFDYVNLYLWSEVNSSQKTAIMCNIGKEAIKQRKKVKFVLAGTLIDRLMKNQGFNYHEDIEEYLKNLKNQDMLLIDDIFDSKKSLTFSNSDMVVSEWDRFLRELCSSGIKVIMTSNVSVENIRTKFGNSIYALIERNFYQMEFKDSIKKHRKKMFENIFDD